MPRFSAPSDPKQVIFPIFPVPVYINRVADDPEFNRELERKIEVLRDSDPEGVEMCREEYRSGYTSFFSRNQIHQEEEFAEIGEQILEHGRFFARSIGYAIDDPPLGFTLMFGTINVVGSYHGVHRHRYSLISGTYYVSADKTSSRIGLLDPKAGLRMHEPGGGKNTIFTALEFSVQPRSGMVVMFPSYLEHSVELQRGERPRVGITFNLDLIDPVRRPRHSQAAGY